MQLLLRSHQLLGTNTHCTINQQKCIRSFLLTTIVVCFFWGKHKWNTRFVVLGGLNPAKRASHPFSARVLFQSCHPLQPGGHGLRSFFASAASGEKHATILWMDKILCQLDGTNHLPTNTQNAVDAKKRWTIACTSWMGDAAIHVGINHLPTGAGFCPSTLKQLASFQFHTVQKGVPDSSIFFWLKCPVTKGKKGIFFLVG